MKSRLFLLIGTILLAACGIERPHVNRALSSTQFDHAGITSNCATCHQNTISATHRPTNNLDCSSCHTPTKWIPARFSHTPEPNTCNECHSQQLPPAPHPTLQGNDCKSCHVTTGWRGANPHNPIPTQCASCHGDGAPQDRWQPTHRPVGTNDCISCHTTSGWQNATFNHSPVPTSCNSCHEQQRPALAKYPGGGTASGHYQAKDCYTCHKSGTLFSFGHSNAVNQDVNFCLPCHYTKGWNEHGNNHPEYFNGDGTCYNCHNKRRSWDH